MRMSICASILSLCAASHAVCAASKSEVVTTPSLNPTRAMRRFSSARLWLFSVNASFLHRLIHSQRRLVHLQRDFFARFLQLQSRHSRIGLGGGHFVLTFAPFPDGYF